MKDTAVKIKQLKPDYSTAKILGNRLRNAGDGSVFRKIEMEEAGFPSSKKCCKCGRIKKELRLSERVYHCECGNEMDRDRNAAINIREGGKEDVDSINCGYPDNWIIKKHARV